MANRFKQKEELSPEVKEFAEARTLTSVRETEEKNENVDFKAIQKKKNEKYVVYCRLDKDLETPLKDFADENGLSVSKLVEILIRKALKKNEI